VALGLGGALREQVVFDEDGHNLTGSFMDYAMSTAADLPAIEIIACHTPSRRTPTGSKGMSEGGVMGAIGAVSLAVGDALAHFGVRPKRQPLSPMAIHALLKDATK
jgi:carbon-monoxide dehydrogenase large subunit